MQKKKKIWEIVSWLWNTILEYLRFSQNTKFFQGLLQQENEEKKKLCEIYSIFWSPLSLSLTWNTEYRC